MLLITGCIQTTVQTTQLRNYHDRIGSPIDVPDAYNLIQQNVNNPHFIILDVRTADEYNAGHIAGAVI